METSVVSKRSRIADTVLVSFVVAIVTSLLIALGMLLLQAVNLPGLRLNQALFADVTINLLILFFLAGFALFKGSRTAAWFLYRHDAVWGYEMDKKQMVPILILSVVMALSIYGAVYLFASGELMKLAQLGHAFQQAENSARL